MQLTPALIEQFNQPETVVLISKYPYRDIARSFHGVAVYTKELLHSISKQSDQRFVVLVESEYDRSIELDSSGKILIIPAFDGVVSKMYRQMSGWLGTFSKAKLLHIHSEYFTSGNLFQMSTSLIFFQYLKLRGWKISYYAHNVVDNLQFMTSHLGNSGSIFQLLNKAIPWYYRILNASIDRFVALDIAVQQRILKLVPNADVELSPIWLQSKAKNATLRTKWRKKLGYTASDFVIMNFGFMTKYKGTDWLVKQFEHFAKNKQHQNWKVLLAGGPAPSQEGRSHYQQFYDWLEEKSQTLPNVHLTGFIPHTELKGYFAAADLVILPYRGILGASASLSRGLEYGVPFILSDELKPYLEAADIQKALHASGVKPEALLFKRTRQSLVQKLGHLEQSPSVLKAMSSLVKNVVAARNPQKRWLVESATLFDTSSIRPKSVLQWVSEKLELSLAKTQ
jgi:glycosyltransferase involved in cell wall biosynthesis